jgi:hypothetical protein
MMVLNSVDSFGTSSLINCPLPVNVCKTGASVSKGELGSVTGKTIQFRFISTWKQSGVVPLFSVLDEWKGIEIH